jgi:cysteine desulfuration protein SufE
MTLQETITEFSELEPQERFELLLEYSENLPPLPPEYEQQRLAGEHRIQECQTPVFLWVDIDYVEEKKAGVEKSVRISAWVAPEAPTVKGFVGILVEAFNGRSPQEVLNSPTDLLSQLGLAQALGMVRARGLTAILFYLREKMKKGM